jgi:hypothetical protein
VTDERPILVVGEPGRSHSSGFCALAILGLFLIPLSSCLLGNRDIPWPMVLPIELQVVLGMIGTVGIMWVLLLTVVSRSRDGRLGGRGMRVTVYEDRLEAQDAFETIGFLLTDIESFHEIDGGIRLALKGRAWPVELDASPDDRPQIAEVLERHGIPRR